MKFIISAIITIFIFFHNYSLALPSKALTIINGTDKLSYSIEELEIMQPTEIETILPWEGKKNYKGPPMKTLLSKFKNIASFECCSLDGYCVNIPYDDILVFDPIIAYKSNNVYMTIRDNGPIMLIYPYSDYHKTLSTPEFQARFIRHLVVVKIKENAYEK